MLENISESVADVVSFLLGFLKNVDLSPIADALETLTPYFKATMYLLPAKTIAQIFAITCTIWSLRLTIKTIKLLWDLLPIA